MNLIPVDSVPVGGRRHNLQQLIVDFLESESDVVRVDFTEKDYANSKSCYTSLWSAIKASRHKVKVFIRGNEVFLSKVK